MPRTVKFQIYRYDPDKDDAPYMQDISVELEPTDRKLLDALDADWDELVNPGHRPRRSS